MEALIAYLILPAIIIYYFVRKRTKKQEFDSSPEHPFKVNIAVLAQETKGALNIVRGRALTHHLEIDVKISPKDWDRIKKAGIYDATLFEYPDPTSTYSGEMREYYVRDLRLDKTAVSFYNIGQAEEAKETLLQNLYKLKDAVELQKEGRRSESFEI
jgi:hypothetical protein